jgi:uncharacterized damage-inducible protein DinB
MAEDTSGTEVTEIDRIIDQMERSFEGDAWHGSSISEILSCITAEQAAARPIPEAHSIWEMVLHTSVWQRTVRERLQGEPTVTLADADDWPAVTDTSSAAWTAAAEELRHEYELLRREVRNWRDHDLGETAEGQRYTVYEMLHGVIQHNLYHAGQIALLKKATT